MAKPMTLLADDWLSTVHVTQSEPIKCDWLPAEVSWLERLRGVGDFLFLLMVGSAGAPRILSVTSQPFGDTPEHGRVKV